MRRIPVWTIILWIVAPLLGVVGPLLSWLTPMPGWIGWLWGALLWVGAATWILLRLLTSKPRKKTSVAYATDSAAYQRIVRETEAAVDRYLRTAIGKRIGRKALLYERPWFLLCGASKAGKTTLLRGSGLNFPVTYPSEADGMQIAGSAQITWYFANEAVWIDVPGVLMDDSGKDEWQGLAAALARVRPLRPADGIALVASGSDILNGDDTFVRDTARMYRRRIDELIAGWGIEFPVYLLFNRADQMPGFTEFFAARPDLHQKQILGATLPMEKQRMMPRVAFADEFSLLSSALGGLRLEMLHSQKDAGRKRLICRFVIHFEGMQEKLGAYVSELFKPSSYVGKPIFRGFYFTSCREEKQTGADTAQVQDVGNTIINHPLNPHRVAAKQAPAAPKAGPTMRSVFVLPLFRSIMVRDRSLVTVTRKRSQADLLRYYLVSAAVVVATVGVGALVLTARNASSRLLTEVRQSLSGITGTAETIPDQYAQLEVLRINAERLERYAGTRPTFVGMLGFSRGKELRDEVRRIYFDGLRRLVVGPAVKYLEYSIRGSTESFGELTGEQYDALYASLKAYLSVSEAVSTRVGDIDTTFLRSVLTDAVTRSLVSATEMPRLPQSVETILDANMGAFLRYLKRQQYPPMQENQRIVAEARGRLQRLPDARSLYQTVINRIAPDARQISLNDMLGRTGEGILASDQTVSSLFTQDGFETSVRDALTEASKNPYNIDWVVGLTKDQVSESTLDAKTLRDAMVEAYLADFKVKWLVFLGSVQVTQFGDLARASRMLKQLAGPRSELEVLLEVAATTTYMDPATKAGELGDKALALASKSKAGKGLAKKADKIEGAVSSLPVGQSTPFDQLNRFFDPLRSFQRSSGGAFGGYQGYRDKLLSLAEKLDQITTRGEDLIVTVLDGKENDPLLGSWQYVQNEMAGMPDELSTALKGVLVAPIQNTGTAASAVLSRALTQQWQAQVVKAYAARIAGRFPVFPRGEDASYKEVMDFFRPNTGTFWGFYDRALSPYLVKTEAGWMVRSLGSVSLNFNPQLAQVLVKAERIRDIFFSTDGTERVFQITASPLSSNKNTGTFDVNGVQFKVTPKTSSVLLSWPGASKPQGAALKVQVNETFSQDVSFPGPWGLLRLLRAAQVSKISQSTFSAQWEVNVQNMYRIQQTYRMQVGGADHPFCEQVFEGFEVPTELIASKAQGGASQ